METLKYLLRLLLFSALYYLSAKVGLFTQSPIDHLALIWPPAGLALATFLLGGFSFWPGVFIGGYFANWHAGISATDSVIFSLLNLLESSLCYLLLERVFRFQGFDRIRQLLSFIASSFIATSLVGVVCASWFLLSAAIKADHWFNSWLGWFVPDSLSYLVITPFLLFFHADFTKKWQSLSKLKRLEFYVLAAVSLFVSFELFCTSAVHPIFSRPIFIFPLMVWGAVRFEWLGSVVTDRKSVV